MTKAKLLRDGQCVGYSRSNGTTSYDNQVWATGLEIPYDTQKQFLNFDSDELVEVYEE
jgi:hypothetical protein